MTFPPNQPPTPPQPGGPQPGGDPYGQQPGGVPSYQPGQPAPQYPNQPYPGQPASGQPYAGQPAPGQPYPGQQPGAYPAYPGGADGGQPPKKKKKTLWIVLGSIGGVILLGIIGLVIIGVVTKDDVNDADDVSVGDCVTVQPDEGEYVKAKKADCGSASFHFVVGAKVANKSACNDDEVYLSWVNKKSESQEGDILCLAPAFQQGKCYKIPTSAGSSLTEFKEIDCANPPTESGYANGKVISRTTGKPTCESGQVAFFYERPTPVGFCLTEVE
ncbi:DUF3824 domain-containing protein [Gordonia sp. ABSL1-1]|uniref:DUF3824 domain-containing protein n=1 Tax=Gordonia sp. ABSL1-1 TaxID=3053923 RepID=UPI0025729E31|nr:DUF3824 domain-containing protein [Gordonia sp. ABSL1-1]MDL9935130.1 DUF3824 domain-containing protein [Gordonia sp. ABSL1-1]